MVGGKMFAVAVNCDITRRLKYWGERKLSTEVISFPGHSLEWTVRIYLTDVWLDALLDLIANVFSRPVSWLHNLRVVLSSRRSKVTESHPEYKSFLPYPKRYYDKRKSDGDKDRRQRQI